MPIYTPTYGGNAIFGLAVKIDQTPDAAAQQTDAFFGVPGELSLFGGTRARTFNISGVLFDEDLDLVTGDENLFLPGTPGSIADGIARTLVDTQNRTWLNVIYLGQYQRDPKGPQRGVWAGDFGWIIPYRVVFHGLA
jgi:hypothetical protein